MSEINRIITITYVSIQLTIALIVSIVSANQVRKSLKQTESKGNHQTVAADRNPKYAENKQKNDEYERVQMDEQYDDAVDNISGNKEQQRTSTIEKTTVTDIKEDEVEDLLSENGESSSLTTTKRDVITTNTTEERTTAIQDKAQVRARPRSDGNSTEYNRIDRDQKTKKQQGFCGLWLKTMWKMRGIYSSLAVHAFDVLTDILVINEWLHMENIEGDNVDPQIMAYCAIGIFIFSKIISSFAIYLKEKDALRSSLQLFDLLIFVEIYEAHKKVISQMRKNRAESIESTLSFKYIRQFEAVFESIPESVLQLIFIMRTGFNSVERHLLPIFIISIVQSIVSMVNSITNNDYTQMEDPKFKKYKQRLPPTFRCFKHFLSRLCEVIYRIGLLALFWTVCGGLLFGFLIIYELCFITIATCCFSRRDYVNVTFNMDMVLVNINLMVVIPSEQFYAYNDFRWLTFATVDCNKRNCRAVTGWIVFILVYCANIFICWTPAACIMGAPASIIRCDRNVRIHIIPLFRSGASLCEFIFLIFWGIFGENGSRFQFLFDWNHGFSVFIISSVCYLIFNQYVILFPNFKLPFGVNVRSKWGYAYSNEVSEIQKMRVPKDINELDFWDEIFEKHYEKGVPLTAAIFAIAKGNDEIIQWLEKKGAKLHKNVTLDQIACVFPQ